MRKGTELDESVRVSASMCVFLSACVREKDGGGKKMAQDSQK